MSYKITIQKVTTEKEVKKGPHKVIARVPWTDEDLEKKSDNIYRNLEQFLAREPLKEVYGYAPDQEIETEKAIQIYEQVVDEIYLPRVILAINNLQ